MKFAIIAGCPPSSGAPSTQRAWPSWKASRRYEGRGGYLSNEISYRTVRLAQALKSPTPVGHIHTPRLEGFDEETLRAITNQLSAMVERAASELAKAP